jgi:GNAT superfamily N-acetyltransferase
MNRRADITIRSALVTEIDTLCAIDNDASVLFEQAGLHLDLPSGHEFAVNERARWVRSLLAGGALLATRPDGAALGFAATDNIDDEAHLDQLSVRTQFMRQRVGTTLLDAAVAAAREAGSAGLWLTTYGHLSWNRPFYERQGFVVVPEKECGPGITEVLRYERRWLPRPEERVAMRRPL